MEREEAEALVPTMLERNDGACESATAFFRSSSEYGSGHGCRGEKRASEARQRAKRKSMSEASLRLRPVAVCPAAPGPGE